MEKNTVPVIGILGGMGPEATATLFNLIIENTDAHTDQEHVPLFIYNHPQIPDRSAFILGKGPDPVPLLTEGSRFLSSLGVSCILWPCNTAHYFLDRVQQEIPVPILNMVYETAVFAGKHFKKQTRFGLLATLGTYHTHLYSRYFESLEIPLLLPEPEARNVVMESIYGEQGIKAGYHEEALTLLEEPLRQLKQKGAEVVIAGCTELSLVLSSQGTGLRLLDPMKVLARAAIQCTGYPLKEPLTA